MRVRIDRHDEMVGAAAMALSSVSVIGNALRLARTKLDQDVRG
jgi:cation transport ATPase